VWKQMWNFKSMHLMRLMGDKPTLDR